MTAWEKSSVPWLRVYHSNSVAYFQGQLVGWWMRQEVRAPCRAECFAPHHDSLPLSNEKSSSWWCYHTHHDGYKSKSLRGSSATSVSLSFPHHLKTSGLIDNILPKWLGPREKQQNMGASQLHHSHQHVLFYMFMPRNLARNHASSPSDSPRNVKLELTKRIGQDSHLYTSGTYLQCFTLLRAWSKQSSPFQAPGLWRYAQRRISPLWTISAVLLFPKCYPCVNHLSSCSLPPAHENKWKLTQRLHMWTDRHDKMGGW